MQFLLSPCHAQGAVAEQNTRLAGPLFDVVQRYEEELGEDTAGALHGSLLEMLIEGGRSAVCGALAVCFGLSPQQRCCCFHICIGPLD